MRATGGVCHAERSASIIVAAPSTLVVEVRTLKILCHTNPPS
jgi:DNA anti-recombination protein RmuC